MHIVKTVTADRLHLTGFLSEPTERNNSIVIHIHGMGGDPYTNSWYPHFHQGYPESGIAFLVGNHRGTDSITQFFQEPDDFPNYGNALEIFEECVYDIDAWVNFAQEKGYSRIILQSHSFGPSKVVYYVSQKQPTTISNLVLISPVDMLGWMLSQKEIHESLLAEATKLVSQNLPRQLLSQLLDGEYYISAQTYLSIFGPDSKANVFCYTHREHDWQTINQIQLPVLMIGGTQDSAIERVTQTQVAFQTLSEQLTNAPVTESIVYPGATHSFDGFEERIIADVVTFLNKTAQ